MSDPAAPTINKQKRGWPKGVSGNPAGRVKGSRNAVLRALDAIGQKGAESALAAVVKAAAGGDMRAAEILLSRCWPARKGRAVEIALPPVRTAADVVEALAAVGQAVADGTLTPEEAAPMAALIEAQRRAIETVDLEERVTRLEQREHDDDDD